MAIIFKKILLSSRRVRSELSVAFGLILLVVLVFLGYLLPGVSSWFEAKTFLHIIFVIVFFILILGFMIIVQMLEPVIKMSRDAQMIAEGDLNREIEFSREDEIGQLGAALNRMTLRMKENVEELKNFSKMSETINVEINKRILILSNLMQISNLIAQNAELIQVAEMAIDKCLSLGAMTLAVFIFKDQDKGDYSVHCLSGRNSGQLLDQGIKNLRIKLGEDFLGKTILKKEVVVIDQTSSLSEEMKEFLRQFSLRNAVIIPILLKGNVYGLLLSGNEEESFRCSSAERELLELIAKQIAIAKGNELLNRGIEKLEVTDRLTGLFNGPYVRNYLNEEIKKSVHFKTACSFVLLTIEGFKEYHESFGHIEVENVLAKIGSLIKANISSLDKAARFTDHEFAIVLSGKNKRQAIDVAQMIRQKITDSFSDEPDAAKRPTYRVAVTENPIDGVSAQDLIFKAQQILGKK
ncbi:MAG TPA: diguanylate cyclase [Candidatus Omnitrophota bacterium]|nr:diguanylate cyclase [Candidatus Omnitrophota bacterium]